MTRPNGPQSDLRRRKAPTRQEAIEAAGLALARGLAAQAQMTAREQAEAAYTPTGPPVDELEDRIRADRGMPPLDRDESDDQ